MRLAHTRDGFALLVALWVIVTLGMIAAVMSLSSRGLTSRIQRERDRIAGRWVAEGCLNDVRSALDAALDGPEDQAMMMWRGADSIASMGARSECDIRMITDGRIVLDRADENSLGSLPGMSPEAIAVIMQMQRMHVHIGDLREVEAQLSGPARKIMDSRFAELSRLTTGTPDLWKVLSRSHLGAPPEPTLLEVTLVRATGRAVPFRWVER